MMILRFQLIGHIFLNFIRIRITKNEMIMEASGTINKVRVQFVNFITSDDKQLFTIVNTIKKRKHIFLRIAVFLVGKSLLKLIKEHNYFLLNGAEEISNARIVTRYND